MQVRQLKWLERTTIPRPHIIAPFKLPIFFTLGTSRKNFTLKRMKKLFSTAQVFWTKRVCFSNIDKLLFFQPGLTTPLLKDSRKFWKFILDSNSSVKLNRLVNFIIIKKEVVTRETIHLMIFKCKYVEFFTFLGRTSLISVNTCVDSV